jgi:hypothetical protein
MQNKGDSSSETGPRSLVLRHFLLWCSLHSYGESIVGSALYFYYYYCYYYYYYYYYCYYYYYYYYYYLRLRSFFVCFMNVLVFF